MPLEIKIMTLHLDGPVGGPYDYRVDMHFDKLAKNGSPIEGIPRQYAFEEGDVATFVGAGRKLLEGDIGDDAQLEASVRSQLRKRDDALAAERAAKAAEIAARSDESAAREAERNAKDREAEANDAMDAALDAQAAAARAKALIQAEIVELEKRRAVLLAAAATPGPVP